MDTASTTRWVVRWLLVVGISAALVTLAYVHIGGYQCDYQCDRIMVVPYA